MRTLSLLVALAVVAPALGFIQADEKDLEGVKCPVSGAPVKAAQKVDYKGGEVYFCCAKCPTAFTEDTEKFLEKANAQLTATKQAEQVCCPLSGRPVDETKAAKVAGAEVAFCCGNCLAKVEGAEDAEKLTLIFAAKPFEKAFKVKEKE
ncbi:YHS domain-containing protein [Tautonia plasticadhaerens]|uniref:YHS domain protein n=1 Tax=Tautonia plasticadhaerens TaxID=2527974 RepID=A0A518GXN4_9BACT|nr:YHS domain-containing protein [Tautonia plasticadhaerens]QDV33323.1 YHS domain protein [Tautonia plasticadhaerens]